MKSRILVLLLVLSLLSLTGCSTPKDQSGAEEPAPAADGGAASGLRIANGLYDLEDGTVQAVGTLEWIDLEGGFYAITGWPEGQGEGNIAVIANPDAFAQQLAGLKGRTVMVTGDRFDGVSVRQAGPEIMITEITEVSDTPGAAE